MRRVLRKITKFFSIPVIIIFLLLMNLAFLLSFDERIQNIENRFGGEEKLKCSEEDVKNLMQNSVVRIIGSLAEGSGFPLSEHEIITNFHVIEGEAAPKIVYPDGSFETGKHIIGNKTKDIAIITV